MTDKNLTISQIAALLRKKKLSPVELARELLHRIERLQPKLNAFITVTADLALRQAREAEREIVRGEYRGPLHGIPVNLKDLFYTRGIQRWWSGSRRRERFCWERPTCTSSPTGPPASTPTSAACAIPGT